MTTPIEALQNRADLAQNRLESSPTAYAPSTLPSKSDLGASSSLDAANKAIDTLRSTQLRNQWYGPSSVGLSTSSTEDTGGSPGLLMGTFKALQRPLNAVAGAAQYALGKGEKPGFFENINNAMKTGVTFGNVLQQEGVPRGVQVPLGFALDVMFDPVNWATMGSSTLVGGIGEGLVKGAMKEGAESGLKGALEAAGTSVTSNLARKAATAMNFVPFVRKMATRATAAELEGLAPNIIGKGAQKFTDLASAISTKAIEGGERFNDLTGTSVYDKLNKGIFGQASGVIGNTAENAIRKIPSVDIMGHPTPSGDQIADFFKYSTKNAADVADLKDKVRKLGKDKGIILNRSAAESNFESIDDFLKPGATISLRDKLGESMDVAIRDADGVLNPDYANQIKVHDSMQNAQALLEAAGEDYSLKNLNEAYKTTPRGKIGVQWFDDIVDKLKTTTVDDLIHARLGDGNVENLVKNEADSLVNTWNSYDGYRDMTPLKKLLEANQGLISFFKSAKVPMNVASHVVSNIGNFFMGAMMGLPMWKPEYLNSMRLANSLVEGRLGAAGFREMFFGDVNSLIDLADNNPTRFKQLTGINASEIANRLSKEEQITHVLRPSTSKNEVLGILRQAADSVEEGLARGEKLSSFKNVTSEAAQVEAESKVNALKMRQELGKFPTPSEQTAQALKEAPIQRGEEFGSYMTSEITPNNKLDAIKAAVARASEAHPGNPVYKLANTIVNSMPRWYEHIDQTFKVGTADYLTKIGLTEPELLVVSRTVPMTADDILPPVISGGNKLYRLTPLKASEVATEAFMNYAAMPDFVRVMRALPIVGSPFLSFPYAMAIKTAKTTINNPALFNKIGFMINEMNANRTPEEKLAMEQKYSQYLKSPTVVKLGGMWNTDVKNLIPYFQMNMLNPSERAYTGNSVQSQIMKLSDAFPIMQDPIGSVIKDYFIQPWLLSGTGETPQGQFGQPIMPSYDIKGKPITPSLGTQAFYGGRTLAESVVPGALSLAGLPLGPLMSPEAVNMVPSYGFRNLANATQGRSSIGATTKEDAVRKTMRSIFGRVGLPAYTLDTTKTTTQP